MNKGHKMMPYKRKKKKKFLVLGLATLLQHVNFFKFTSSKVKTKFFNLLVFKCVQVGESVFYSEDGYPTTGLGQKI